jgi:recombinational DNA repair protein (RecF pathway)
VIAEWLLRTTVDEQPLPAVFTVTDQALRLLSSVESNRVVVWWKLYILNLLGWGMQATAVGSDIYFNFLEGSFVDSNHKAGDSLRIAPRVLDLFKTIYTAEARSLDTLTCDEMALTELDLLATRYLSTIIERDLKADRFRQQ